MESPTKRNASSTNSLGWLSNIASAAALLTLISSLFGYGVVMGIAMSTGQDHGGLVGSAFDLISLMWPGVLMLMTALTEDVWLIALAQAFKTSLMTGMALGLIVLGTFAMTKFFRSARRWERIRGWANNNVHLDMSTGKAFVLSLVLSIAAVLVSPILQVLGLLLLLSVFVIATTIPAIGFTSGQAYVERMVMRPPNCANHLSLEARAKAKGRKDTSEPKQKQGPESATCVAITSIDTTKPFLKIGRMVISSSNHALIWDPTTGSSGLVPLAGMEVTTIDQAEYEALREVTTGLQRSPKPATPPPAASAAAFGNK